MPTLRCDCGTEVQVPDEEAQELTWCPNCHKTLIQPKSYQLPDRNYRSGNAAAPRQRSAPSGDGIGAAGRVIGILAMAIIFGLGRASCHSSRYEPPNVTVPHFQPPPRIEWQPPPDWPGKNWPGAAPQDPAIPDPERNWQKLIEDNPNLRRLLEGERPNVPGQPPDDRR
jgi:hypothetical protein